LLPVLATPAVSAQPLEYPQAARDRIVDDYHGTPVADPWRPLERLDSPRTTEWVRAQIQLTSRFLAGMMHREAIRERLLALSYYERIGVPWSEAGRLYYLKSDGLMPQPVLYAENASGDPAFVIFDPNRTSPDGSISMRNYVISPGGRLLAFEVASGGADISEIHLREIASGKDLDDVVRGSSLSWTRDERGFFYVSSRSRMSSDVQNGAPLVRQVFYHTVGKPQAEDRLVFEWQANVRWAYTMASEDFRYIIVVAEEGSVSEIHAIDLGDPDQPDVSTTPAVVLGGYSGFHTPIDIVRQTLFVRTDFEAPLKRVIALDLGRTNSEPRTIVPEASDVIVDAAMAGDLLIVNYLSHVHSRLRLFTLDGEPKGEIALPEIGAVGWPLVGRPSGADLFYTFTSFLSPDTVYRYDLQSGQSVPFKAPPVLFDRERYETRQLWFESKDGTRVPTFVTAAKDMKLDGGHPTFLTAYGGYGANSEPAYAPGIPLWLEMGGVYAVANIRGGGEYGETWHRAGMLEHKQTSFDDFIAAAEYLVSQRYTTPDKLAIYGHSNGGLLVGAVMTQRPELFGAAVANAGHYDMLRYHRFTAGAGWVSEYGSPDDQDAFPYLRAYSPLHNVREDTCYPATLLLAADHDDRVVPSHSYKFAAALQAAQSCANPILLRIAPNASHSYASGQEQIAERTDLWSFLATHLGVETKRQKEPL
jgi:prolyl oligopeptidase